MFYTSLIQKIIFLFWEDFYKFFLDLNLLSCNSSPISGTTKNILLSKYDTGTGIPSTKLS
jgi:hypothetical protein